MTEKKPKDQPDQKAEVVYTAETDAPRGATTTVTLPAWGPPEPDPGSVISLQDLLACEFNVRPATDGQKQALDRFQEWCRSHAIGGSNRNASDEYDDKVRDLVRTAQQELLGVEYGSTLPTRELFAEMQRRGAVVTY